jgi:hypothetical protein
MHTAPARPITYGPHRSKHRRYRLRVSAATDPNRHSVDLHFDDPADMIRSAAAWPSASARSGAEASTICRNKKEGETTNDLFAFLTTEPNKVVGAIHPKAMPAILTTVEEIDTWMNAPTEEALKLQRPLADDALMIVARGENIASERAAVFAETPRCSCRSWSCSGMVSMNRL